MSDAGPGAPRGGADGTAGAARDVEQIQAEIQAARAQLSRTVDELSARLDVPARARERAYRARDTAVETYRENPPLTITAALVLAGAVLGLVIWRRKRAERSAGRSPGRRRKR
jgi:Protein of unknown function (DUF3618)